MRIVITSYIVITVLFSVLLYITKGLYDEKNLLLNTVAIEKSNNKECLISLDKQNKAYEDIQIDYDSKLKVYYDKLDKQEKRLKGKPSDECEEIKRSLDDVLNLNL